MVAFYKLIFLLILSVLTCGAQAHEVTLTVEGGVNLVRTHCPGTIRLFCKGVDLVSLRWNYNASNVEIESFYPDDNPITRTHSNTAFLFIELTSVSQSSNPIFGNFTSTLTVDLSQLERQHITMIRCGDPGTFRVIPIGVQIYQLSTPQDPQMVSISASFQSSVSVVLTVSWKSPVVECPQYKQQIVYVATLTGGGSFLMNKELDEILCVSVCNVSFSVATLGDGNFFLQLQARSDTGVSNVIERNIYIGSGCANATTMESTLISAISITLLLSVITGFALGAGTCYLTFKNCVCLKQSLSLKYKIRQYQTGDSGEIHQENPKYEHHKGPVLQQSQPVVHSQVRKSKEHSEQIKPEHYKPAPYEEPIRRKASAEIVQHSSHSTHSYCKVDEGGIETATPTTSIPENVELKPNLSYGKARREGVISLGKDEIQLNKNQSYGKTERDRMDKRPEYDYIDM